MFNIQEEAFGSLTQLELSNVLTGEYVTIIHDYGTLVNDLVLKSNGKNYSILRGTNTDHDIVGKKWFKGAKLSPFPNRIRDGAYSFNRKKYQLPITEEARHNALHGFIYNKPFELIAHEEGTEHASVEFEYNYGGKIEGYPFPYRISMVYTLSVDGFECETCIKNTGKDAMPVGDGWHPYFKTGTMVDQLQLLLPKCKRLLLDKRMIANGKRTAFNDFDVMSKIGPQEFDTPFELENTGNILSTELFDAQRNLKITLWQETGTNKYNYLQIYIPPDRQSIAIEPMTCEPDAFNNGGGLITLKPNEVIKASYGVSVK